MIDDIDRQILNIIQQDARISNAEIARQVNLAPSAVLERMRKLENSGIIKGYSADIKPKEVGFGLTVFVNVRTSECGSDAGRAIAEIPEVWTGSRRSRRRLSAFENTNKGHRGTRKAAARAH